MVVISFNVQDIDLMENMDPEDINYLTRQSVWSFVSYFTICITVSIQFNSYINALSNFVKKKNGEPEGRWVEGWVK